MAEPAAAGSPTIHQCSRRGCIIECQSKCASVVCNNWICVTCYEDRVLKKFGLCALPCPNGVQTVACTKKCYQSASKDLSGEGRRAWDTDTPTREYAQSSEAMLIDWLLVHGNYDKWKGNSSGISKREIQKEIADILNKKGFEMRIQRGRTQEQVGSKIAWLELKYRETKAWIENTGQGIREEIGEESFQEKIEKERFKHFYTLQPIMSERACMGSTNFTDDYETWTDGNENNTGGSTNSSRSDESSPSEGGNLETAGTGATNSEDEGNLEPAVTATNTGATNTLVGTATNTGANTLVGTSNSIGATTATNTGVTTNLVGTAASMGANARRGAHSVRSGTASQATRATVRGKSPLGTFEDVMGTLDENRKRDREQAREQLQEQMRHNREMEDIEYKKSRSSIYDSIEKSMNLFFSSQTTYEKLKETMSLEQISQAMPICIKCFDFALMTEQECKKFAKHYNEWAVLNGITDRINPDIYN